MLNGPILSPVGLKTFFSPAARDDLETVAELSARIYRNPHIVAILEAIPGLGMILTPKRQIVAANRGLIEKAGVATLEGILGLRFGESVGCLRVSESPSGCGTGRACALCGAGTAIQDSLCERYRVTQECRISIESIRFEALDFEVVATPLPFEGEWLTVCAMRDISGENRRRVLERVFFHDVMNTAGGLKGLAEMLLEPDILDPQGEKEIKEMLAQVAEDHVQEIDGQRLLMAAENGDVRVDLEPFQGLEMLRHVRASLANHAVSKDKQIRLSDGAQEQVVESDLSMVRRILVNMTKNALEAIEPGQAVTLDCARCNGHVRFAVQNPGEIPRQVRLQIFNRSFSTKADRGRGIGTYSMKLLGENYLKGQVGFESDSENGTTFWLHLPLER